MGRRTSQRSGPERRAPEPLRYSTDQLLGRAPTRLRRRRDKVRFAAHIGAAAALVGLSLWLVLPAHAFVGPVLLSFTRRNGVHVGDLPALVLLAVALRSLELARRTLFQPLPAPADRTR